MHLNTQIKSPCAVLLLLLALSACGRSAPPNTNSASTNETPVPATPRSSPLTGFAKDLQDVKDGQFSYIWIFSRKDGKPLDKSDSQFLRTNAPQVVDWVVTDGGKKVIAGTNFNLEEGNLAQLKKRYVAEDWTGK